MHPPRRRRAVAVLALLLATVAPACGDDDEDGSSAPATEPTTTTAKATSSTSSPTPTEPAPEASDADDTGRSEIDDGRHFGYWKTFEIGDTVAFGEFDLAYFLGGEEAERAAEAAGEEVSNDYFIVNDNPRLRTLLVDGDARVEVLTGDGADATESNVADFAVDRHPEAGFWVTVEDGLVTEIEEQYQP